MPALQLASVTISTAAATLIADVTMDVDSGEVWGIIGPNGAGKTTLLRAISGDLKPTSGSVLIAGRDIGRLQARQRARQLAILPQSSSLDFPYTVEEVIALSRIPHNTSSQCNRQIVGQALRTMDILPLREHPYTHLSGGEKQRVQLARVMAQIWRSADAPGTRLLLLDEPTAALDLGHRQQLMEIVRAFANQGVAVIMVVHDVNLVARHADKLLALSDGRPVALGQPKATITAELINALYGVDAQVICHPDHAWPVVLGL